LTSRSFFGFAGASTDPAPARSRRAAPGRAAGWAAVSGALYAAALGRHTEVHLFVPCPSDDWWADLRSRAEIDRQVLAEGGDAADLHLEEGHPLLGSLGRLPRDFQLLLEDAGYLEPRDDLFADPGTDSVLHTLQSDLLHVRTRREGGDVPPLAPASEDRSIRVEACHGPMRQVEVLADALHGLFEELPDLQPRDVVVMTPDVEAYAPLIEAVFDRDAGDPRHVPWRIVDRGLRLDNPVARALQRVLELADGRLPASEVLDLLVAEPVRRRFSLGAEDLETLTRWVARSGVRWGIDAGHRQAHGQPGG